MGQVENKILDASDLVKKTDYNDKISDIKKNISLLPIIMSLRMTYLIQR